MSLLENLLTFDRVLRRAGIDTHAGRTPDIVRALAQDGHDVTFTYRSAAKEAEALLAELAAGHPGRAFAAVEGTQQQKCLTDAFRETHVHGRGTGRMQHHHDTRHDRQDG